MTNALKYTATSATKKVTVHIEVYDSAPPEPSNAMRIASPGQSFEPPPGCIWCIVGVEDSGKGLTPDELKLLFARFSQGESAADLLHHSSIANLHVLLRYSQSAL